jgi:group I intron endonuclease
MRQPVIYTITCVVNHRFYVGSTVDTRERFRTHRSKLRQGAHHCKPLQAAWNKYGEDCFKFVVTVHVEDETELEAVEDAFLAEHVGQKYCYNTGRSAKAPWRGAAKEDHPSYGVARSTESKERASRATLELYKNPDYQPRRGRAHSEAVRAKISAKMQQVLAEGRGGKFIPSEATRRLMSESLKGNQNAKGHVRTEEHRRKLSEANKGNTNWVGKTHTAEARAKMSKRVREITTDTEFPSLSAALEHYGMTMPTLSRVLKSGKPLAKGRHKGLCFEYL